MAGVSSTVRLNDAMSPALRNMNRALTTVLQNFENLQSVSNNAVDVAEFQAMRSELDAITARLNTLESEYSRVNEEIRQARENQDRFTEEVERSENAASGLAKKVAGLVGAYATFQTLMGAVNLSDTASQTQARLSLIVDDGGSLEELERKIFESAVRSRADYTQTANSVAALANNAGAAFKNNDEIIAFLEAVNKQFVIGGADSSAMANSMTQLTQGLAAGALRGDELNSVLEGAPGIARAIEESMGWASGSIKQYAEEGLVTAEVVKNALLGSMGEIDTKFNSMPMTWAQTFTTFKNYAVQSLDPLLSKISELANNKDVQKFVIGAGTAVATVGSIALEIFELLASIAGFVYDNWSILAPLIAGVVGILTVYWATTKGVAIAQAVLGGIMTAFRAAQTFVSIGYGVITGNTAAAAAAQFTYNSALLACPLTWILIIIIAVIAAIYAIVAAVNKVTGSTYSATGIIVGVLTTAVAFIWNLFVALIDFILGCINVLLRPFIKIANFIGNVFTSPISSVIYLFQGLADACLGVLQQIAEAMDYVFGSDMGGTIQGWRDDLKDMADDVVKKYAPEEDYQEYFRDLSLGAEDLGLDRWEYGDAWDKGYTWGEEIANTLSDTFSMDDLTKDITTSSEDLLAGLGDISNDTSSIADSMEISEEDLKYLRDIAEQEAINRFTTASIKIDMQNSNNISSDMDIDGIVSKLEDKLYESMSIAAEGVY